MRCNLNCLVYMLVSYAYLIVDEVNSSTLNELSNEINLLLT